MFSEHVQGLARRIASGDAFSARRERWPSVVPAIRQLTAQQAISLLGKLRIPASIFFKLGPPDVMQRRSARSDPVLEMLARRIWDKEPCVCRPSVMALCQPDLLLAQWLAVCRARIL